MGNGKVKGLYFSDLFDKLSGSSSGYSLEERLFYSSLVIGILAGVVTCTLAVFILDSPVLIITGYFLSALLIVAFILAQRGYDFKLFIGPVLVVYLLGFILMWFFGGGADSQNIILAIVLFIISLIIVSENKRLYVLIIFLLCVLTFYLIQLYFPQSVKPYGSVKERWIDSLVTIMSSTFFIYILVRYILKNYSIERKKSEQRRRELIEINADKDRFISILSHDLKGPFSALIGLSGILKSKLGEFSNEQIKEYIDMIDESARKTYGLLEDLLIWSSTQQGKISVLKNYLTFRDLAEDTICSFKQEADSKNISLQCNVYPDITFYADNEMIKIIMRNLISNAIKFTQRGGYVSLFAEKVDGEVTISIVDSGVGLTEDKMSKLFDITQVHSSKGTEKEEGTGLGLIICKELVSKHGGKIWLDSNPGNGTTVRFTIPSV